MIDSKTGAIGTNPRPPAWRAHGSPRTGRSGPPPSPRGDEMKGPYESFRDRQDLDALDEPLDRDRLAGGEEAAGGVLGGAIDDDLAMVRLAEPLVAGLVAGDEPVGVDHRGEAVDRLGFV